MFNTIRHSNVIYKPHGTLGLARRGISPSPGPRAVLFSKQTTVCQEINTSSQHTTANNDNNDTLKINNKKKEETKIMIV